MRMNWSAAEMFCVSKGGHLASVPSHSHWLKLYSCIAKNARTSSRRYDSYEWVWLGGTDEAKEGEWAWTDGSKWSEEHWSYDQPCNHSGKNYLATSANSWQAALCQNYFPSVCSVPTKGAINSDTQLVFTSENISMPAIKFRWVAKPMSQGVNENGEVDKVDSDLKTSSTATNSNLIGGFKLSWKLKSSADITNHDSEFKSVWKIANSYNSSKKDLNLMRVMNLVRESKKHRVKRDEVWKTVLKHRWDIEILKTNSCLNESQVAEVIYKSGKDLNLKYGWNIWIPEEDIALGSELFSSLHYCPEQLTEAAKMSAFFESLLTNHSLNSLVVANIKDFTAINMWYQRLDERYNFSLGRNILPLLSTDNLEEMETINPPFLEDIRAGINDIQHDTMSSLFGKP